MNVISAYWFPDLQVTAVDYDGPTVEVYRGGPGKAVGAAEGTAVHVINVWDHARGQRLPVTAETIRDDVTAWWHHYPDDDGGGGGEAA